jgi:hypothetical protein
MSVAAIKKAPPAKATDPLREALVDALEQKKLADAAVERAGQARSRIFKDIMAARKRAAAAADETDQSVGDRAAELAAAALAGRAAPPRSHAPKADTPAEIAAAELTVLEAAHEGLKAGAVDLQDAVVNARIAIEAAIVAILETFAAPLIEKAAELRAQLAPLVGILNELTMADNRQTLGFVPEFFGSGSKTMHDARGGSFKSLLDAALKAGHLPALPHDGGRWVVARTLLLADPFADIGTLLAV